MCRRLNGLPVKMDQVDDPSQDANANLKGLFEKKGLALSPDVQIIIRPAADVPYQDVITVYDVIAWRRSLQQVALVRCGGVTAEGLNTKDTKMHEGPRRFSPQSFRGTETHRDDDDVNYPRKTRRTRNGGKNGDLRRDRDRKDVVGKLQYVARL